MNKTFSLCFLIKRSKQTLKGLVPIYLRVTIDCRSTELSTKRFIDPEKWDGKGQRHKGFSEEAKSFNHFLDTFKQSVYKAYNKLELESEEINVINLKERLTGKKDKILTLIPIFEEHNKRMKTLIGNEFAPLTLQRYESALKHVKSFLTLNFNKEDYPLESINHSFLSDFEFYLRSVRKCGNNSAVKYVKNLGKIIRICIANGWLSKDPFVNYKSKIKPVIRVFLSEEELDRVIKKHFEIERLSQVRDVFVFSCFTGLAFADVEKLTKNNLCIGIDGKKWIFTMRQKTGTKSNIPLLPAAEAIIQKYKGNNFCEIKNKLLPVLSNQKMNAYLKEIANICGIKKELTYHIARHTFATTVTLLNGVPIESVSKMLGHSSIKMTQHYAKITDAKVSQDMLNLHEKYVV